jgi:glutamine---fructose-6-phosphate transaminase (isomerizing)
MCGIFGYLNYGHATTRRSVCEILVNGLRRLEYRGYDSAGISIDEVDGNQPEIFKIKGNVNELEKLVKEKALVQSPDKEYPYSSLFCVVCPLCLHVVEWCLCFMCSV